jgi:hypothetical protein
LSDFSIKNELFGPLGVEPFQTTRKLDPAYYGINTPIAGRGFSAGAARLKICCLTILNHQLSSLACFAPAVDTPQMGPAMHSSIALQTGLYTTILIIFAIFTFVRRRSVFHKPLDIPTQVSLYLPA